MGQEDEIRLIAYRIWEKEGCCHGHDIEYWLKAEVIWKEQPTQEPVPESIKTESKHIIKQGKRTKRQGKSLSP